MLNEALTEMRTDPESFLRHYLVTIAGGAPRVVPQQRATFTSKAGDQLFQGLRTGISGKVGLMKERPQLRIVKVPDGTTAGAGEVAFQAWFIPMTDMSGGAAVWHTTSRYRAATARTSHLPPKCLDARLASAPLLKMGAASSRISVRRPDSRAPTPTQTCGTTPVSAPWTPSLNVPRGRATSPTATLKTARPSSASAAPTNGASMPKPIILARESCLEWSRCRGAAGCIRT